MIAKIVLSWTIALTFFVCECYIHWKCGFHPELYQAADETQCLGNRLWGVLPNYTEAICQSTIAVMLLGMLIESVRAALHGDVLGYLYCSFIGDTPRVSGFACISGCFTMGVGFYNLFRGLVGHWGIFYLHIMETACTAAICICLLGLTCDFLVASFTGKALEFIKGFALCKDKLDEHAELAPGREDSFDAEPLLPNTASTDSVVAVVARALALWTAFITVLAHIAFQEHSGLQPSFFRRVFAIVCSGGITMSVVFFLANVRQFVSHSVSGRGITAILPRYNPDSGEGTGKRNAALPGAYRATSARF